MLFKKTMFNKFMKIFTLLVVIPILVIGVLINKSYKSILLKEYSKKNQELVTQISRDINYELKKVHLSAATISNNEKLKVLLNEWNNMEDGGGRFNISQEIDTNLNYIFNFNDSVNSIIFFFKNKGYYYYKAPLYKNESEIREEKWYKEIKSNNNHVKSLDFYSINSKENSKNYISVAISPISKEIYNNVEMIYFNFKTSMFDGIYSKYNNEYGDFIIVNSQGKIIVNNKNNMEFKNDKLKEMINENGDEFTKTLNDNKYYINKNKISNSDWYLVNITNYNKLTEKVNDIFKVFIFVYIIIIFMFIAFILLFFKNIIKPVNKLLYKMKSVESLDFDNEIEVEGNWEIFQLGISYNKMIKRINKLVNERDMKEKQRTEEEIKALQAQIKPHFLYNTLNSIRLMAMMAGSKNIENMVDSFMKLLSATFRSTSSSITLYDEIENVKNYIYIMKIRFGDDIDFKWYIDENTKELQVFKLILQPIIENCFLHGVKDIERKGEIVIKSYIYEEFLTIEVIDNGVGISEGKIKEIFNENINKAKAFNNIGILNIHKRIQLSFGKKYGLEIVSEKDKFTSIKYLLPVIEHVEEE